MTLLQAIRTRLLTQTPLTALVSTRVYTLKFPQSPVLPSVRLQEISRVFLMHLRGLTALYRARVQVDAVCKEGTGDAYDAVHAVAAAARGAFSAGVATGLAGFKGTVAGVEITGVLAADQREGYDAAELQHVKVSMDYIVWFKGSM